MLKKRDHARFLIMFCTLALLTIIVPCFHFAVYTVEAGSNLHSLKVEVNLLNFRVGPSLEHTLIEGLPFGTSLQLLFREGDWLLVKLDDGKTGWVCAEYTSFTPSMADRLISVAEKKVKVEVEVLNVRLGPGLDYAKIGQLSRNTTVTVYAQEGEWLLVRLADGSSGWINSLYISSLNEKDPATKLPGQALKEEGPAQNQAEKEQYPYKVSVNVDSLRLRKEPGLHNAPVGTIPRDTILNVLQSENEWLQVELPDGKLGWVAGWYTQRLEAETQSPLATYFRLATVNADVLRVRSGPGLEYAQTGRVYFGDHLLTLQEQNGWYYVQLPSGEYGWISGDYASIKNVGSQGTLLRPVDGSTGNSLQAQNITIVIDPGHGGRDAGATGISGLKEKSVNLRVAQDLVELLRARGFNAVMTRNSDINVTLAERVALAERARAGLFISIHANAHPNKFVSGTETYYYDKKATSAESFYLATLVQQEMVKALKLPSLGVKKAPFHVIRETTMPAILVELAFLSNAVDEAILASGDCLRLGAEALYRAILQYYNLV